MRNWVKTILFLTTFSPVLITLAAARYINDGFDASVIYYTIAGILGVSLNYLVIRAIRNNSESIAFTAKKIESNDALMLGVLISYFLPFVSKSSSITVGVVAAIFAAGGVIFWFSSSILPHPVLRLFNYRFYKVESATGVVYTLISQRDLLDPKNIRKVKQISKSMLVEVV